MLEREKETLLFQTLLRITLVCNAVSLSLSLPRTRRRRGGRERGNEAVNGSARHSSCGSSSLFPHFSPARMCLIANNVLIRRRTRRRAGSCVTHTHTQIRGFHPRHPLSPRQDARAAGRTLGPPAGRSGRRQDARAAGRTLGPSAGRSGRQQDARAVSLRGIVTSTPRCPRGGEVLGSAELASWGGSTALLECCEFKLSGVVPVVEHFLCCVHGHRGGHPRNNYL